MTTPGSRAHLATRADNNPPRCCGGGGTARFSISRRPPDVTRGEKRVKRKKKKEEGKNRLRMSKWHMQPSRGAHYFFFLLYFSCDLGMPGAMTVFRYRIDKDRRRCFDYSEIAVLLLLRPFIWSLMYS